MNEAEGKVVSDANEIASAQRPSRNRLFGELCGLDILAHISKISGQGGGLSSPNYQT
jgi:hypothetical protein